MCHQDFSCLNCIINPENVQSRGSNATVHPNLPQRYYLEPTLDIIQEIPAYHQVETARVDMSMSPVQRPRNLNMLLNSVYYPLQEPLSYVPAKSLEATDAVYLWSECQKRCQDRNQDQDQDHDGLSLFTDELISPLSTERTLYDTRSSSSPPLGIDIDIPFGTYSANIESPYSTDSLQTQIGEYDVANYSMGPTQKQSFENHPPYPFEHILDENIAFVTTGFYQPPHHNFSSARASTFEPVTDRAMSSSVIISTGSASNSLQYSESILTNSATTSPESVSSSLLHTESLFGPQGSIERYEYSGLTVPSQGQSSGPYHEIIDRVSHLMQSPRQHAQSEDHSSFINEALTSNPSQKNEHKPHGCTVCEKSFARKHDLGRHMRIHTGDKPYMCLCCKKAFARTDALSRHFSREEACGKSAVVQASLRHVVGRRQHRKH